MKIDVERFYFESDHTIGRLSIDGQVICQTLEPRRIDWSKEQKVPGRCSIPEGTYRIKLLPSTKFKRLMPRLMNVPQFEGILIHKGTTVKDTAGCLLVGYYEQEGKLSRSHEAFQKLMERIEHACKNHQEITITIR